MIYELTCQYDTRKCFYGKAKVKEDNLKKILISYQTEVAEIFADNNLKKVYYQLIGGKYSQTTTRHQKEFFKQNGLSDKEIKELFKNGILEKEVLNNE